MPRRLLAALLRGARVDLRPEPDVHFHSGPAGGPAVCHDPLCVNPRLSVNQEGTT